MKKTTKMMGLAALLLLLGLGQFAHAQFSTQYACKGDIVCHTLPSHRGTVQWSQSTDGITWTPISGATSDTLCAAADNALYYRADIYECFMPLYSEVVLVQPVEVTVDAGSDQSFCGGGAASLGGAPTASGGLGAYSYQWLPVDGLNNPGDANPVASPLNGTVYTLTVTDSLGCVGTDTVAVTPLPGVTADAGPDMLVCTTGSEVIGGSPSGSGGTGSLTYAWSPATYLSATNVPNPTVTPSGPQGYLLTVTDSMGCAASDSVSIDTSGVASSGTITFTYTGAVQTFVVPSCTDSIDFDVFGAQGGANWVNNTNFGGRVTARIAVTPGETLLVYVGQQPTSGTVGGWNGGGAGDGAGKGGGGGTDVRRGAGTLNDRIIVAGAGGGAGYWSSLHVVGGAGGGLTGGSGYRDPSYANNPGGLGGTQTAGGATGTCINLYVTTMAGSFGQGGTPLGYNCGCEGYGGGGGWYGGAGSGNCRGAGGGSSYTLPGAANVIHQQGVRAGNGQVILTW